MWEAERLVERGDELAVLERLLGEARAGRGRIALVTAEAGGGKTALIERFLAAPDRGVRVLRGACDALFTPRPLGPIRDFALDAGSELEVLLRGAAIPYQVAAAVLDELSHHGPTVLVIEDAHWADEASLDVLRLLARRVEKLPVLVVLSYRDDEVDPRHPLRVTLGEVAAAAPLTRVALAPLSSAAVAELAAASGGETDVDALHSVTGGNPFFVTEVLASDGTDVPTTVRDAVLARAARLSPAAREVLEAVAIATPHAELQLVEQLVGDVDARLDECIAAGMLIASEDAVMFRHELARLAVEESIPAARRLRLNRTALDTLVAAPNHDLARIAHHADAAGDGEAVLRFAPAAATQASGAGAHRESAAQYARALRYAHLLPPRSVAELLASRSRECYLTDQADDAIAALQQAAEIHRELGDRVAEGATLARLANILWCPGRGDEARATARQAVELLEQLPPSEHLATAYASLASVLGWAWDREGGRRAAQRAVELAEQTGHTETLCQALTELGWYELGDDPAQGLATMARAAALAEECGLHLVVATTLLARAQHAIWTRDYDRAPQLLDDCLHYAREHGNDLTELYLTEARAAFELSSGRWTEAADSAALVIGRRAVSTFPRTVCLTILALVRARRGDPDVLPLIAEARELSLATGELGRIEQVAMAEAEIAWLRGDQVHVREATDGPLALAIDRGARHLVACLQVWRRRAGIEEAPNAAIAGPHALELRGDAAAAAAEWKTLRQPYEAALALAHIGDEPALRESLALLTELGARGAAAIVTRRLRALGVRDIERGPRPSTRQNAAGLTTREAQVLALVAAGHRNADIAEQLFLSRRTVDNHVSAILRKLGVENRVEAATAATRLGLVPT